MEVSNFVKNAKFSLIRKMFNESQNMEDLVSFAMGEPDFDTPEIITDEACKQWYAHKSHYTPNKGIYELRKAVAEYHANDLKPDPNKTVVICNGGSDGIRIALCAILNPGDEVIVITPCWANYFSQVAMYGAKVVEVTTYEENEFRPTVKDVENAITPRTKCIMINYPCNPTGAIMDEETAKGLAHLLDDRDIYLLSDEVYSQFIFDGYQNVSVIKYMKDMDKVIYLNSFSKMFAMTGWRVAYIIASEKVISGMGNITECGPSCLPKPTQLAAAKGLECCLGEIDKMKQSYDRRRKLIYGLLKEIPLISCNMPKGTFYMFVNIKKLNVSDEEFCMDLLHKAGVVMVPGSGFGEAGKGYVRIAYATSDESIIEGMKRLKKYIEENYVK